MRREAGSSKILLSGNWLFLSSVSWCWPKGTWALGTRLERFRVDGWKRYVNVDRFRVDGDKNMRLLAFAFTIVFVWTGPKLSIAIRLTACMISSDSAIFYTKQESGNRYVKFLDYSNRTRNQIALKVIPLKLFYYQTFFETWRDEHPWYEHCKNAIKKMGSPCLITRQQALKMGCF